MKLIVVLQFWFWVVNCDTISEKQVWDGNAPRDLKKIVNQKFDTIPKPGSMFKKYEGVTTHIELLSTKESAYIEYFDDPFWKDQWYVHDYRQVDGPVMDHNVAPVYRIGYAGRGVLVAMLDDDVDPTPRH